MKGENNETLLSFFNYYRHSDNFKLISHRRIKVNFIGHINFFLGEVIDISGDEMTFKTSQGKLKMELPPFKVTVGDRLKAVIRPESIDIADAETEVSDENVLEGRIDITMYIGSIVRYTITTGDQIVYLDEVDPQYRGIFQEGEKVKLV
jgi:spermidine/putrescine transport system ATP-binding protein